MSSAPPPSNPPPNPEKKGDHVDTDASAVVDAGTMDITDDAPPVETWDDISEDILALSTDEILTRARLIDNDIKVRFLPVVCFPKCLDL
jgi:26S proteasome regulatory subunit T5